MALEGSGRVRAYFYQFFFSSEFESPWEFFQDPHLQGPDFQPYSLYMMSNLLFDENAINMPLNNNDFLCCVFIVISKYCTLFAI
jgi:hypothetical protein